MKKNSGESDEGKGEGELTDIYVKRGMLKKNQARV